MIARVLMLTVLAGFIQGLEASAAIAPTDTDRLAFAAGQSLQRQIDVFQNPGICGIVLERRRCAQDFGSAAPYAAFVSSGDLDLYDNKWLDANLAALPADAWKNDPKSAWLQTAGILSISGRWPRNPATDLYPTISVDALIAHGPQAGQYSVLIPEGTIASLSPAQAAAFQSSLLSRLDGVFATAPFPLPAFSDSAGGDIRLGIYSATLQELVDSPIGLSEPASRSFGKMIVSRIAQLAPAQQAAATRINAVLDGAITDPRVDGSQIQGLRRAIQSMEDALLQAWPQARKESFLLGMLTAQIAYNAAVLKEKPGDVQFRAVVASLPVPALPTPAAKADFQAMLSAEGGDWKAVNPAATRATLDLMRIEP